jgi:ribosomal protein L11 methyltransferase
VRALFALGAEGVQELDDDVVTHLRGVDAGSVAHAVGAVDAGAAVELSPTPDVDWSAAWKERIGAHRVGQLVVTPPWLANEFTPGERIVIDPAMAFGTGEHETTRGVIRLMHRVIRSGDRVADLGAGSAVLAIAAARLGAARVAAIELDPDAIGNAEENVAVNGVADRVMVIEGDAGLLLPLVAPVRVVLANIISSVLLELMPTIAAAIPADGRAILSGILAEERGEMERALVDAGWSVVESDQENQWWSATVARA